MKRASISFLLASLLVFTSIGNVKAAENLKPKIQGKAGITMDIETGEIIYENNIDEKQYPASTTKLMTALLFAENKNKQDSIKYTESAKKQPEYSIDKNLHKMQIGESMSGQDAMDALMLFSANDVAYMIADNVSGDSQKFADLMNERAKKLGLSGTHFVTPNGLHDPNHYTTSYDLSVIGREAFKNDWVRETMAKRNSRITTSTGSILLLENRNKLVGTNDCIGGKTGYTAPAGRVLVGFFEKNGRKLVGVVMNSVYDSQDSVVFDDMKKIIDWSYNAKQVNLHKNGDVLKTETVTYKPLRFFGPEKTIQVPLVVREDVNYYDNDINKKELKEEYKVDKLDVWNLSSDKASASLSLKEREAAKSYKLYSNISTKDIVRENTPVYVGISIILLIVTAIVLLGLLKITSMRHKTSRRYY